MIDYKLEIANIIEKAILKQNSEIKIDNLKDFYKFIDDFDEGIDKYKKARSKICKLGNQYADDNNSKRVIEIFLKEE